MGLVNVLAKLIGISMVVAAVSCSSAVPIEKNLHVLQALR